MKILLVDDEAQALQGLERILMQTLPEEWEVLVAHSGPEALETLSEERDVDVVVTDLHMPGMDGAELLARAHAEHPEVIRFILSGQLDEATALRSVPHAHQFLAKPCMARHLCALVERSVTLRDELSDESMQRAVGDLDRLPPLPATYAELTKALDDPDVGMADVAAIVARDPALATKLLQLVNSAFFARGAPVSDVKAAVQRLGLRTLQAVALGAAALRTPAVKVSGFDPEDTVRRSVRAATLARSLAASADAADAFLTGLLSCVGLFALGHAHPEGLARLVRDAAAAQVPLACFGAQADGISHARVGAYLLGLWGIPDAVVQAVALQAEAPQWHDSPHSRLLASVHVATRVAFELAPSPEFVEAAGLTDRLEQVLRAEAA